MDAKNLEDKRLNLDEFTSLVSMINGTPDDFNVAVENIRNILNITDDKKLSVQHTILLKLILKHVPSSRRYEFSNMVNLKWSYTNNDTTLTEIHESIFELKNEETLQKIFAFTVNSFLAEGHRQAFPFLKDVETKIKW